jgi:hypothetical protein
VWIAPQQSTVTYTCPTILPQSITGTRPVLLGANFNDTYFYEAVAGTASTSTAHRPGNAAGGMRGNVSFSPVVVFPGTLGTAGQLARSQSTGTPTPQPDLVSLWGVDATGNIAGQLTLTKPVSITDNDDSFVFNASDMFNISGSTGFRGSNGQVALAKDQAGRYLMAAMVRDTRVLSTNPDPVNGIAVARFDPANPAGAVWTMAAYNNFPNGKSILDGANGTPIGQIVELDQVDGGSPLGPSMSCAALDSVGNVWFTSAVEIFGQDGRPSNFATGLVRAVYNPANFSYRLELVMRTGSVFAGQNSTTNFQIRFMSIATNAGATAPDTLFSGDILPAAWNNMSTAGLSTSDPRTLGGIVLAAEIVYDVNRDGNFVKVTGSNGDPTSLDQEYNALLYIGNTTGAPCRPDINGDGQVNVADFLAFLQLYAAGDTRADFNNDSQVNVQDFLAFLAAYAAGCR